MNTSYERGEGCGHTFFAQHPGLEREEIEWEGVNVLVTQDDAQAIDFDPFVDGFIAGYFRGATEAIERIKVDLYGQAILDRAFEIVLERIDKEVQ